MAINASMQWWIRQSGNALNGGGFDSAVTNAGTNYADQDAPQLSLTDLATSAANSTTLTSATGGFTAAMIGNVIRIASGTNFTAGYYVVTAYTNTNTVTLDRTPSSAGAGSSGVGRLGGAFAWVSSLQSGGDGPAPAISTPLVAGNRVNIRGSGSNNPTSADYTTTNYHQFPPGNHLSGHVKFIGYNGRPRIDITRVFVYNADYTFFENFLIRAAGLGDPDRQTGMLGGRQNTRLENVWFDQNGFDRSGANYIQSARFCRFFNSGSTAVGSLGYRALTLTDQSYGNYVAYNDINGWKSVGVYINGCIGTFAYNTVRNCKLVGLVITGGDALRGVKVIGNAFYANGNDAMQILNSNNISQSIITQNIFESNTGYGINCTVNTAAVNDNLAYKLMEGNFFYNNSSGSQNAKTLTSSDVILSASAFVNAASGDFNLNNLAGGGALVRQQAIVFPGGVGTSYVDGGPIQAIASGGGGLLLPRAMNGGYSA